jgi:hypothetical protein
MPNLVATLFVVAVSASADAQWIHHPTPGTPRTAD